MANMFCFDPAEYADQFANDRFVHIKNGVSEEFLAQMKEQVAQSLRGPLMQEYAIGDKEQAIYSLPTDSNYLQQLCDAVGGVCGLDPAKLILSERHIKTYNDDANPNPLPHKDRVASEITVGLPVTIPAGSKLVLYPDRELSLNPFNSSTEHKNSLTPERSPQALLRDEDRVEVSAQPGDVVMFWGSRTWHMRINAAGTASLFLKLNSFHCDPLGEDPRHLQLRDRTATGLALANDDLENWVPLQASRVDFVHRRYDRHWNSTIGIALYRSHEITIDESEFDALQKMDGQRTIGDLLHEVDGLSIASIRRLADAEVLDLLPPRSPEDQRNELQAEIQTAVGGASS